MKVCRYDEGNTVEFLCPYHGWSYGTDGALVGVPFAKDAYGAQLDRSQLGPRSRSPQMENYKGTIWATWDPVGAARSPSTSAATSSISTCCSTPGTAARAAPR